MGDIRITLTAILGVIFIAAIIYILSEKIKYAEKDKKRPLWNNIVIGALVFILAYLIVAEISLFL